MIFGKGTSAGLPSFEKKNIFMNTASTNKCYNLGLLNQISQRAAMLPPCHS